MTVKRVVQLECDGCGVTATWEYEDVEGTRQAASEGLFIYGWWDHVYDPRIKKWRDRCDECRKNNQ